MLSRRVLAYGMSTYVGTLEVYRLTGLRDTMTMT